ncbi:hypothetical protein SLE2022_060770 [Rubroshorea leprosula]
MAKFNRRNPGSMAIIVEKWDILCFSPIHYLVKCCIDVGTSIDNRGPWCISQKLNMSIIKPKPFHQDFFNSQHVIDATMQLVLGVGVIVGHQNNQSLLTFSTFSISSKSKLRF